MLELIRENKRWAQAILVLLILPFACTGIQGYRSLQGDADSVAKVAGTRVSQREFEDAQRQQLERLRQMFGGSVDAKMLDTPEAKQAVLDQLITQHALDAEAQASHFVVTDDQLRQFIMGLPVFQDNGAFSKARYDEFLAAQRLTDAEFDRRLRADLALQRAAGYASDSTFVPQSVSMRLVEAFAQRRVVRLARFSPQQSLAQVHPSDEALRKAYADQQKRFEVPEHADIEYLVLDEAALAPGIQLRDEDIKQYYDQNASRYRTEERRRARHILIGVASDAPKAAVDAARAKADGIRAQLAKNPGAFESLARQVSDDPGSKDRGGDLDFLQKGATVKPFEDAAFALKEGDISPVVQTPFGFHIIQITKIEPAQIKPLAEVRGAIESEIRKQLVAKKFAEVADVFTNTVYEQADSLKPAAEKLGLKVQSFKGYGADTAAKAGAALANPKVLQAAFSDDAVRNHRNTAAIDVAPNTLVSVHVVAYTPKSVQAFEAVREQLLDDLRMSGARELAKQARDAALDALRKGQAIDAPFDASITVSRRESAGLPSDAVRAVMRANVGTLPSFAAVDLGPQGFAVARIEAVEQAASNDVSDVRTVATQVERSLSEAESAAHVQAVRQRTKVEILKPVAKSSDEKAS